jgi:hypothetical protein
VNRTSQTNSVERANLFENVAGYGFSTVELPWTCEKSNSPNTPRAARLVSVYWDFSLCHFTGKDRLHLTLQRDARLRALSWLTTGNPISRQGGLPIRIQLGMRPFTTMSKES